jgi:hypothetical protein
MEDETSIDDDADEVRIKAVLDTIGRTDELDGLRARELAEVKEPNVPKQGTPTEAEVQEGLEEVARQIKSRRRNSGR